MTGNTEATSLYLDYASILPGTNTTTKTKCQGRKMLDACLEQLPPILDQAEMTGIPSTKKEVEASCR